MDQDQLWQVLDSERAGLADFLRSLTDDEWNVPSLCAGWRVREVAAHLTLGPRMSVGAVLVEVVRARGSFNRMVDSTARQAAAEPTDQLVEDLRGIVGSRRLAPGQKLRDAVFDVLVHGQDMAIPLGRDREMPAAAATASADHIWRMGFPFHTRKRLRGFRLAATDVEWSAGEGAEVRGPIAALVLLMAGRHAVLPELAGDGAAELATRAA